ncbi:MAG: heme-binding domain-containing protein [Bacteroidales bacterium]|jgi:mono/diheme cytochrome c family protein
MKKIYLLLLFAIILVIVTAFVRPVENPIPDNLKVVFKNSCMACHSDNGGGMAKANLNFSKWDTYSQEKQAKKASSIGTVVLKGTMPPKSFIKSHPEVVLSDEQKAAVIKWSESFKND